MASAKIAIHNCQSGFHPRWVEYCKEENIPFKLVNCYSSNIITDLQDCDALMWHHSHSNSRDILIAKQILFALEHSGFSVFPDFRTAWHFDDKLAQKYLFEQLNIPHAKSYVFTDKTTAENWIETTKFPKVFKLRIGAGASNVKLVRNKYQALKLTKKAFGKGFSVYNSWDGLKERIRKFTEGKTGVKDVIKGIGRFFIPIKYARIIGRQKGYIIFQDFIADNNSDYRIIIINNRAFALKRFVRKNDFRASGSGDFEYDKENFPEELIRLSFDINEKLKTQCGVYDFVYDSDKKPLLIEVSYGFTSPAYDHCPGYWDSELNWKEEKFNPQAWMVDTVLKNINDSKKVN